MASNPILSINNDFLPEPKIVRSMVPTPFFKKINQSYRIPKLPKKVEAAVIQYEKMNFEEILPNRDEIHPRSDEILPNVNKKKTTDYEVQKFLEDIDLVLDKECQLNSNTQSRYNTDLHKLKKKCSPIIPAKCKPEKKSLRFTDQRKGIDFHQIPKDDRYGNTGCRVFKRGVQN